MAEAQSEIEKSRLLKWTQLLDRGRHDDGGMVTLVDTVRRVLWEVKRHEERITSFFNIV